MLVVFAVIAILVAIALPVYAKQREVAQESAVEQRLHLALRVARAVSDLSDGAFPQVDVLLERMGMAEPSLEMAQLPSLLAPAEVEKTYVVRSGTTSNSILLAGKSEAGTLHTLFWEDGKTTYNRTRQPTYEELVLSLKPSAYWPLTADLLDRSGNGWTLSGPVRPGAGAPLLFGDPAPSAFFDASADSFLTSDYTTRRNLIALPRPQTPGQIWPNAGGGERTKALVASDLPAALGGGQGPVQRVSAPNDTPGMRGIEWPAYRQDPWRAPRVEPGKRYGAGCWLRALKGSFRLRMALRDEEDSGVADVYSPYVTSESWQWAAVSLVAPQDAAGVRISLFTDDAQPPTTFEVAACAILADVDAAPQPGDYFDGSGYVDDQGRWVSQPRGGSGDRRTGWAGAPFASESAWGVFADGTQRTFVVWAKAQDLTQWRPLLGNHAGSSGGQGAMHLRLSPDEGSGAGLHVRLANHDFNYPAGSWPGPDEPVMVALVADEVSDEMRAYVNGRELPRVEGAWSWNDAVGQALRIGHSSGSSQRWLGELGHVAVFERALSAEQICSLWQAGSGEDC